MRSHSFAVLALLTATSALVACGETVDVGDFEDGTGGAGGGISSSGTSSPTGTSAVTSASGTPTSTSTGGDGGGGGGASCAALGGQCLSDPNDPGFPAICDDLGMIAVDAPCEALNEACCAPAPAPCEADAECAPSELCDPCATSSCPECDDCIAGCVEHDCDPGGPAACDMIRPDCGFGLTAVVRDGCYICVDLETCEPPPAPTPCDADAECAPSEVCDPCATSSCPECDDCIAGCVAHDCDPGPEPACDVIRPDCDFGLTAVVRDGCYVCIELSTCEPAGGECGGETGIQCDDDEFCDFPEDSCGESDESGVCRPRPTTCQTDGPVACSCDGENYPSVCEAAMHGFDIWAGLDFCPAPQQCGGIAGLECDDDQFCDYPNDRCGGDDGLGVCRYRPTECSEPNPDEAVCGCVFGDSFPSECEANKAGQDITFGDGLECGGA